MPSPGSSQERAVGGILSTSSVVMSPIRLHPFHDNLPTAARRQRNTQHDVPADRCFRDLPLQRITVTGIRTLLQRQRSPRNLAQKPTSPWLRFLSGVRHGFVLLTSLLCRTENY
jgi:hypothetical protein